MKSFSSKALALLGVVLFGGMAMAEESMPPGVRAVDEMPAGETAGRAVGVFDAREAGFAQDPWLGYDREGLLEGVDMLRRMPPSPVLARMVRNLLMVDVGMPAGPGPDDGAIELGRVRALLRAGMLESASSLAQAWPGVPMREDLARTLVEAMFLAGDNDAACLEVEAMRNVFAGNFWLKSRAVCQFLVDQRQAGLLSVDILRDHGDEADFLAVADAMQGRGRDVARVEDPDALVLALMRVSGVPLLGVETEGRPVLMAAMALSSEASPQARLDAGLGLAGLGVWDGGQLSRVLVQVPFDAKEIRNVDLATAAGYGIRMLPLVYQALNGKARLGKDDDRRAGLVLQAMSRMPVVSGGIADVFRTMLAPLAPDEAIEAAIEASALFYLGQQDEIAGEWRAALVRAGRTDVVRLWPLAVLAGQADMSGFEAWRIFQEKRGVDVGTRTARVLGILDAMGHDVPLALRVKYMTGDEGQKQDPVLSAALEMAAGKGQQARCALLAIRLLAKGSQAADLPDLALVLSLFREAGLERWADALAREALAPML